MASSLSNHVILVGFGKLGLRTYEILREVGESVVVIERDDHSEFLDTLRRHGTPLIVADARREAVLSDANLKAAKSIVLATSDDLANLEIALDARKLAPHITVVLRLFDQNMADKIRDGFNIHIAMSQSAISAPTFAMAAVDSSILGTYVIHGELVVMQRWEVQADGPLCGKTIGDVLAQFGFAVVDRMSLDGARRLFPTPELKLESGDRLVVQGPFDKLKKVRDEAKSLAVPKSVRW